MNPLYTTMTWVFLIPPALAAAFLAWTLKRGKIYNPKVWRWCYRANDPSEFWRIFAIGVFIFVVMAILLVAVQFPQALGCDPQHMRETGRCLPVP